MADTSKRFAAIKLAQEGISDVLRAITDQLDQHSIGRTSHDRGITIHEEQELKRLAKESSHR